MTDLVFHADAYLKTLDATVTTVHDDGSLEFDRTIFFASGGGQPGDTGSVSFKGQAIEIIDTVKGDALNSIIHRVADHAPKIAVGETVSLELDWTRRYRHMRMHTMLHLLCALIVGDVTGGQISADKARLDFNLPDGPPDKEALQRQLNDLVAANHSVAQSYAPEGTLKENPGLVRTMAVAPPSLNGMIRLVTIGDPTAPVDHQPCGGTHVARTGEIGQIIVGKIENKGRQNRRINLLLAD